MDKDHEDDIAYLVGESCAIKHHVTQMREWGWCVAEIAAVAWRMSTTCYRYDFEQETDYDFADNTRYARAGVSEEVDEYMAAVASGCCGSIDQLIMVHDSRSAIMFGFNYGH